MTDYFIMCARAVENNAFIPEPGPTLFLKVPEGKEPSPSHAIDKNLWQKQLRSSAIWGKDSQTGDFKRGDILVFVHGYNNRQDIVMKRHARLRKDLIEIGYKGEILSFDWPSDDKALNYMEDRHDAKLTAMQLVTDGISLLSAEQAPDCEINIHILAHSTGAYVVREAFDDADDSHLANNSWMVSQILFIGGDISSSSMSDSSTNSLFRHCTRLTNYSNLHDSVLKLSNAKRIGMAPRVGRIGLPGDKPQNAVNIDCSDYFSTLESSDDTKKSDQIEALGTFNHSWHIGNRIFTKDLFETIKGDLDRSVIPTRAPDGNGGLKLIRK